MNILAIVWLIVFIFFTLLFFGWLAFGAAVYFFGCIFLDEEWNWPDFVHCLTEWPIKFRP